MTAYRVILSPDGGEGNGLSPDDLVTMSRAEFDALLARSELGAKGSTRDDRAPLKVIGDERLGDMEDERASGSLMTNQGNSRPEAGSPSNDREACLAREIAVRDQRVAELDRAYRTALRDRALAVALCSQPLISGAAAQLIKLWRDDFDVYEENNEYRVSARDGRTIEQTINDWLASTEYAHFCLPSSRGGVGPKEGHRSASTGASNSAPRNLGEAIVSQWRKEAMTRANDPNKPIGLGRRR